MYIYNILYYIMYIYIIYIPPGVHTPAKLSNTAIPFLKLILVVPAKIPIEFG